MRDQQVVTQLDEVRGLECVDDFIETACGQLFQVRISNVSGSNQKQFARFSLQVERVDEILVFRDDDSLLSRTERSLISASDVRLPCGKSRVCTAS